MHWFVLALVPTGGLTPEAARYLAATDVGELPYPPDRHTRWSDPAGTAHFAGWEAGPEPHSLVDDTGMVAFAGLPWRRGAPWPADRPVIRALRDDLRTAGWVPHEELGDAYALVSLEATGTGVIAADPFGVHPLYCATVGETTVFGNRADLVAEVAAHQSGRPARRSQVSAAWMALMSYPTDDSTGFEGVRLLPQHSTARIAAGTVALARHVPPPYACEPDEPLRAPEEVAEEVATDVVSALRHAIARSPERPHLELTGGKDTRLVLAVALHAGIADSFTCATYGADDLPDMQVARSLAARCGLDHEDVSAIHFSAAAVHPLPERYARHVQRTCGTSDLGNANEPVPARALSVSGMLGETYRTASDRDTASAPASWDEAAERFRVERRPGSLGLVRPELASELVDRAVQHHLAPRTQVRGPEALRLATFLRCGLPRWQGPLVDLNGHRMLPLYSPAAIRASFRLGHEARAQERVHRYLIGRAGRGLVEHPLANAGWRGDGAAAAEIVRGASSVRRLPRPAAHDERRRVLLDLIDASPTNAMFDIVDPTTLRGAIEGLADRRAREQGQVMGAMAALIWLGGTERRRVVDD